MRSKLAKFVRSLLNNIQFPSFSSLHNILSVPYRDSSIATIYETLGHYNTVGENALKMFN